MLIKKGYREAEGTCPTRYFLGGYSHRSKALQTNFRPKIAVWCFYKRHIFNFAWAQKIKFSPRYGTVKRVHSKSWQTKKNGRIPLFKDFLWSCLRNPNRDPAQIQRWATPTCPCPSWILAWWQPYPRTFNLRFKGISTQRPRPLRQLLTKWRFRPWWDMQFFNAFLQYAFEIWIACILEFEYS